MFPAHTRISAGVTMSATLPCNLCGSGTFEAFRARGYRRPTDKREYSVRWCDQRAFGQIHGISATDIEKFYDIPYYTHGPNPRDKGARLAGLKANQASIVDRLVIRLAWRVTQART